MTKKDANDLIEAATRTDENDLIGAAFKGKKECSKEAGKKKASFGGIDLERVW